MPSIRQTSAAQSLVSCASTVATDTANPVTIIVRDANGDGIEGIPASLVPLAVTGTGNTLTQPTAPTNSIGEAVGAAFASSVEEAKTVSVTVAGLALDDQPSVTVGSGTYGYLTNNPSPSASVRDLVYADAITGNDASYDTDWQIENFGGFDITLSKLSDASMPVAGAGCRFAITAGVSDGGGGPRIQTAFADQSVFYASYPLRLSADVGNWPPNSLKLLSLNQGVSGQVILKLNRWDYGGAVPLDYYIDVFAGGSFDLNVSPGTGRGTLTAIQAGTNYEIELLVNVPAGRIRWWVRNADNTALAPVLQGDYSGLSLSNIENTLLIVQQGGSTPNSAPESTNVDIGRLRLNGVAA